MKTAKINQKKEKRAQEEIVGFAIIIVIVAVILLAILGLSLRGKGKISVESYEVSSFLQAALQYTTNCYNGLEYLPVQQLIFECENNRLCDNGQNACEILNFTLSSMTDKSWKVSAETPVKGYKIRIITEEREILLVKQGNETRNYKSSMQSFSKQGTDYTVSFNAYY